MSDEIKTRHVVLILHEDGSEEFARIDYRTGSISGSIGYNAMSGDIEKARINLYGEVKTPLDR